MPPDPAEGQSVTHILEEVRRGEPGAIDRLLPLVYAELHAIAGRQMRPERPDHTLQPTALVHDAFLRMVGSEPGAWRDRTHFLSAAARVMRHVLVDHARARNAAKRGAGLRVTLDEGNVGEENRIVDLLVLDDVLARLEAAEPRWARVVELRFFAGLEVNEVAAELGTSPATVKRDWQFARAWLARELGDGSTGGA